MPSIWLAADLNRILSDMAQQSNHQARIQRGFTLIELLVVLVILALLAGLVGPQVLRYLGSAKTDTARLQIEMLSNALDLYRLDTGRYPTQAENLKALVERPASIQRWNGPYTKSGVLPHDPWGREFIYRVPSQHNRDYDLLSLGSDGAPGGAGEAADIVSWQRP